MFSWPAGGGYASNDVLEPCENCEQLIASVFPICDACHVAQIVSLETCFGVETPLTPRVLCLHEEIRQKISPGSPQHHDGLIEILPSEAQHHDRLTIVVSTEAAPER